MSRVLTPDVLFVGGGIAGCAGAVAFHKKGYSVLVVERDREARGRVKGEYLQPYAVEYLRSLGFTAVADGEDTVKISTLRFRDLGSEQEVLSETLVRYPAGTYAAIMPNQKLVLNMRTHAQKVLKNKFLVGATIEPMEMSPKKFFRAPEFLVTLSSGEKVTVAPKWVVGADGRQSVTRKWMGGKAPRPLGSATFGSPNEFIVGMELDAHRETSRSPAHQYEVIRSEERGTLAIFKLDGKSRRCYWSAPAATAGNSKKIWQETVESLFQKLTPEKGFDVQSGPIKNLAGSSADTTWLGPAARGCFFLVGDALAITTPFGGQGMTCAIRHIDDLLQLISAHTAHLPLAKAGSSSLVPKQVIQEIGEQYKQNSKALFNHFNLINFGLYYLFFAQNFFFKATTAYVLKHWSENPHYADRIGRLFGGLDQDTPGLIELMRLWGFNSKLASITQGASLLSILARHKKWAPSLST
jgi:2-polyprenyl-6-methoxyphenol hydroxylase-like FAD-dependent oxidoreductase